MVRNKVTSGNGLRALPARDRALEAWLRTEATAAYDEAKANPSALASGAEVRAKLEALRKRAAKTRP